MSTLNVKLPEEMEDDLEAYLADHPHYMNKSELARDALRHLLNDSRLSHRTLEDDRVSREQIAEGEVASLEGTRSAETADVEREPPEHRDHDTYRAAHWEVLDINDVDKVFATASTLDTMGRGAPAVRLDLDGHAASSSLRTLGEEGDNVNASVWLSIDEAHSLADQIAEAIPEAEDTERPDSANTAEE